ncbi:MAG: MBL fold metallo-hydrolase [bacterium]|nr:MBL fold metallo-hydrolase [bacterium]
MRKTGYFTVKELLPGVYGFTNCAVASFLIVGQERALLFDTGYGVADLKQAVEEVTKLPLYVVNSHGHFDHTVGNSSFPGPYYMHKADLEVYHRHNSPDSRRMGLESVQIFQRILFFLHWIPKNLDVNAYLNGMPEDDFIFVKEGYTFDLGGVTAEVVEIPGHTPGSIGLLVREKKLFLASDGVNANTWLFLPESQKLSVYQASLRKIDKLDFDFLLTGHSLKLEPRANLKNYLAVAMNPDVERACAQRPNEFAPGVTPLRCLDKANRNKKRKDKNKAGIVISKDKL